MDAFINQENAHISTLYSLLWVIRFIPISWQTQFDNFLFYMVSIYHFIY